MKRSKINKLLFIIGIFIIGITINYISNNRIINLELTLSEKALSLREHYANYLANSPFKKTLKLTKEQRKAQGLPPNKYYEREWELTMNPATGKPEPIKIFEIQKRLNDKSVAARNPGDAVNNSWIDRGPNNVGGRTRVVLFDPNDVNNQRVYAGGVSGGLWVNQDITNAASSWIPVSGVPGNMNISCIAVDPNNSNIWYIGTGEQYTFGAAVGNGVYKTTDGGTNWVNVPILSDINTVDIFFINDIVAWNHVNWNGLGNDRTELFIGVGTNVYGDAANPTNSLGPQSAGLYKSIDDGLNWSRMQASNLELTPGSSYYTIPNDFEVSANNTLWMGTIRTPGTTSGGGKVFSSSDGTIWTEANASPLKKISETVTTSNRVELAASSDPLNPNKMYALTQGTTTAAGPHIFSTTDGFSTVIELAKPSDADTDISDADFTRGQAFYDLVIEVDPTNDAIVYVGGIDLFRTDQGENTSAASDWKQISKWSNNNNLAALTCSKVHADQHAFTFRPGANNEAVIGCDGGVYYASSLDTAVDNDVFTVMNTDYNVTQFYYGGYGQSTTNELILAGAQDNGTPFINGAVAGANSSFAVSLGDGAYSTIDKGGDYMISSYIYNTHYYFELPYIGFPKYTIDDGATQEGDFINPAGLDHNLNIMYSNGTGKINRYTLGASSATKAQLSNALLDGNPTAFKVSPFTLGSTTLLVGTDNGKLLKLTEAQKTNTNQVAWTEIIGLSFVGSISSIEFGATESEIFVTFHNYGVTSIWYTLDGGVNWLNKEGTLPDMPVKCILQNPLMPNEVIVGTELGVWGTRNFDNASPTWIQSNNGMRDVKVVDLDLRTADNSILATTFGRGVFTGQFTNTEFTITTENSVVAACKPNEAVFNFNFNTNPAYNTVTTFTQIGAPVGASITFSPNSLNTQGVFTMTIGNLGSITAGDYPITVSGTGLDINTIDVVLKVTDPSIIGNVSTISPINQAADIAIINTNFNWNTLVEATSYDFEISTDAGFNTIVEAGNPVDNFYVINLILNSETVYYWRVRPKNDCITGDYSATKNFQTESNCNIYSNNTIVSISDAVGFPAQGSPAISILNVPKSLIINDVNVTIDISHSWISDLEVTLISPQGNGVLLFDNNCTAENDLNITYDDSGVSTIVCGINPVTGIVQPTDPLSDFNSEIANGDWTLEVVDFWSGDTGVINSWSIEICEAQTVTQSSFTNSPLTVGINSTYILKQAETEAISAGSTTNEQMYMLAELPTKGEVRLSNIALLLGETFSQDDINTSKVTYVNVSGVSIADSFKVDITNATGGFSPNQQIDITIDAALAIDNYFFGKTGISIYPTVSDGNFIISSSKMLGETNIEIYSILGQKVYVDKLNFNSGNIERINVQQLASGIYMLKLTSGALQGSKKIIIN